MGWAKCFIWLCKSLLHATSRVRELTTPAGKQYRNTLLAILGFKTAPPYASALYTIPWTHSSICELDIVFVDLIMKVYSLPNLNFSIVTVESYWQTKRTLIYNTMGEMMRGTNTPSGLLDREGYSHISN